MKGVNGWPERGRRMSDKERRREEQSGERKCNKKNKLRMRSCRVEEIILGVNEWRKKRDKE